MDKQVGRPILVRNFLVTVIFKIKIKETRFPTLCLCERGVRLSVSFGSMSITFCVRMDAEKTVKLKMILIDLIINSFNFDCFLQQIC